MELPILLIRSAVGIVMIIYGINQIHKPKTWFMYVPSFVSKLIPERIEARFMQAHGGINVGLGILFFTGFSAVFVSWATFAWWLSILPFAFMHEWRTGLRDFAIVAAVLAVAVAVSR